MKTTNGTEYVMYEGITGDLVYELDLPDEFETTVIPSFKDIVLDELVCCHIYTKEHETDPRKAVKDLVEWNIDVDRYFREDKCKTDLNKLIAAITMYLKKEDYHCICRQGYICAPCCRDARIKPLWQALEEVNETQTS